MRWDNDKTTGKLGEMLGSEGDKLLVFHHDADGICAAAVVLRSYPKMKSMPLEGPGLDSKTVKEILSHNADVILFVDLPVDQEFESLMKIKKKADVVVIDHHIAERDLSRWGILHINPKMEKDVYIPASYMAYRLMDRLKMKPQPSKWIACVGVYGDYGMKDCAQFLSSCGLSADEMRNGAELVAGAVTVHGLKGAAAALRCLLAAEDYTDFSRNSQLKAWRAEVNREFGDVMGRFDGGKELYPDAGLVVYEIKSRLNVTSAVSNRLSELLPDLVVMIKKKSSSENEWKLSLRCQSGRVNLGNIAKKCSGGIGSGGGHVKAAGAMVSDYDKFLARLRAELKR
jgi:single-stranded DNA-specific DHH superfamily exonuclease